MKNIVLIGMPGAGKSTIGVILAKTLGMQFIDTDLVIQEKEKRLLQDIIDKDGIDKFLEIEESCILSLGCIASVISTGGSVVYSPKAMEHLRQNGIIFYLNVSLDELTKRLNNIKTRGIVLGKGKSLVDVFTERIPLYEKHANEIIDCKGKDIESIVGIICKEVQNISFIV